MSKPPLSVVAAFVLLAAAAGCRAPRLEEVKFSQPKETAVMEWNGPFSNVSQPRTVVVNDEKAWERLWKELGAPEAPVADLQVHYGVAVFLGERSTGGYGVRLLDPIVRDGKTVVRYRESVPRGIVIQAITYPYAVRLYPKTGMAVVVEPEKAP